MLRNGSGGARPGGEAVAAGAERGAAATRGQPGLDLGASVDDDAAGRAPAEHECADQTPACNALPGRVRTAASPGPVGPDHGPAVRAVGQVTPSAERADSRGPDPSGPLSLCRLNGEALAELGRQGLLGVLGDIERVTNRLAGYRAEVLGALDVLNQSGAAPDASPHLSLRDAAGVSERDARQMVRAAGKAREHDGVLEALSEGDINTAQAEALCDARVPDEVRAELVAAAGSEDTDATRRRVRQAEADHSVETPTQRFERQRRARGAGWQRDHEGMLRLWAKLDPEVGAQVEAGLEALRRQYWLDDKQVRSGRRTPVQRDADVLAYALAGVTLTDADTAAVERLHARARQDSHPADEPGAGNPERRPAPSQRTTPPKNDAESSATRRLPPAQISVLIGLDALRGRTDEMGLTDAGVELPPEVVRRLACDAEIIPMMLGGPGGSADAGRARRTVPLRLRRLLVARDRHCRWPGCHEPPSRCDAHHVWHWLDGGPTDLGNLVLLCHRHHHHLHQYGYRMVPQPDGTWTTAQTEPAAPTQCGSARPRAP